MASNLCCWFAATMRTLLFLSLYFGFCQAFVPHYHHRVAWTALSAKKKAGAAAPKKVQVKLLKHIAGTGQAGQVIQVTPAFFNNKLRPTKSAVLISDDEVAEEQAQARQDEQERVAQATAIRDALSERKLELQRKAGPDGQLFGGIGPKNIMEELKSMLGDEGELIGAKGVKITSLLDGNGKKMRGDIKHTGEFVAMLSLTKDITAKVEIVVEANS